MLMFFALPPSSHDTPQETVTKLGTLKTNQKEKKENQDNQENQENQKKHDDEKMTPILKPS